MATIGGRNMLQVMLFITQYIYVFVYVFVDFVSHNEPSVHGQESFKSANPRFNCSKTRCPIAACIGLVVKLRSLLLVLSMLYVCEFYNNSLKIKLGRNTLPQ
jgi:hypothetical protein